MLIGCALTMAVMIEVPWLSLLGFGILGAGIVVASFSTDTPARIIRFASLAGWTGTILAPASFLLQHNVGILENYYALLFWLMAAASLCAALRISNDPFKTKWRAIFVIWGFFGSFVWLAASYAQNLPGGFYIGLLGSIAFLILCRLWFRLGAFGIQTVNTLVLMLVAIPTVDFFMQLHSEGNWKSEPQLYYSYEAFKKNPTAYANWTRYCEDQWARLDRQIFVPAPDRDPPIRLRPGSHGVFFKCPISINSRGIRGREFPDDKGDTYRIVTIGESTTFGATLTPEHHPWPELLEQMIHERLKTRRPVQVINAGVIGYHIETNLRRLASEILPLKPDMIISYHGFNGFSFIDVGLPSSVGKPPPPYVERPLNLLGDLEYGIKLTRYKKRVAPKAVPLAKTPPPMQTRYAQDYRELIQTTRTNRIRLVLANYCMAVTTNSDPALIEFFRGGSYPLVFAEINANAVHSAIVRQLAEENPDVCFVDTHPNLDNHHDKFIDLVHFTQPGDQQFAETMFAGIRKILEEDLSPRDQQSQDKP